MGVILQTLNVRDLTIIDYRRVDVLSLAGFDSIRWGSKACSMHLTLRIVNHHQAPLGTISNLIQHH